MMNSAEMSFVGGLAEYAEQRYADYEPYRRVAGELFDEFRRVAALCGIDYYMMCGSLLAIEKFALPILPWDDDYDVAVPVGQVPKLIDAFQTHLKPDFYVVSDRLNSGYCLRMTRICKKGYNSDILHMDIFYLCGLPDDEQAALAQSSRAIHLAELRGHKFGGEWKKKKLYSFPKRCMLFVQHLPYMLIPRFWLKKEEDKCIYGTSLERSDYCFLPGIGDVNNHPIRYRREWFGTPQKRTVDGIELLMPCDSAAILELHYGEELQKTMTMKEKVHEFFTKLAVLEKIGTGDGK